MRTLFFFLILLFAQCGKNNIIPEPIEPIPNDTVPGFPPKIMNNCVGFSDIPTKTLPKFNGWNTDYIITFDPNLSYTNLIYFYDENLGFNASYQNIFRTMDGGKTWTNATTLGIDLLIPVTFRKIQFFDALNGVIIYTNYTVNSFSVLYTNDGGQTWQNRDLPNNFFVSDVHFLDPATAWASLYYDPNQNNIQVTRDSGNTWTPYALGKSLTGCSFQFIGRDTAYIADNESAFYYTYDSGANWTTQSTGYRSASTGGIQIHFINPQVGYLYDQQGMRKTTDGGRNWILISQRPSENILFLKNGEVFSFQPVRTCPANDVVDPYYYITNAYAWVHTDAQAADWTFESELTRLPFSNWQVLDDHTIFAMTSTGELYKIWR